MLLLLHITSDAVAQFKLEAGDFSKPNYHVWGYTPTDNVWEFGFGAGFQGQNYTTVEKTNIEPSEWYYLLLRIGKGGDLYGQLWKQQEPDKFVANIAKDAPDATWTNLPWRFTLQVFSGGIAITQYTEFSFPDNYVSPDQPDIRLMQ